MTYPGNDDEGEASQPEERLYPLSDAIADIAHYDKPLLDRLGNIEHPRPVLCRIVYIFQNEHGRSAILPDTMPGDQMVAKLTPLTHKAPTALVNHLIGAVLISPSEVLDQLRKLRLHLVTIDQDQAQEISEHFPIIFH